MVVSRERMEEYDRRGLLVVVGKTERTLKVKQYLDESRGRQVTDWWDDISQLRGYAASQDERTGYATQKPEALLDRIIRASSNDADPAEPIVKTTPAPSGSACGQRCVRSPFSKRIVVNG